MVLEFFPFPEFRRHQREKITEVANAFDCSEYVILQAPTGSGKSAYAITLARDCGNAHICTATKQLQDQYLRDFSEWIKTVKGRGNFSCLQNEGKNCDEGFCRTKKKFSCEFSPKAADEHTEYEYAGPSSMRRNLYWIGNSHCPYWQQKCDAMNSGIVIHNYPYFILETNYVGDFGPRELLVCDEAHNIEDEIMKFKNLRLSNGDMNRLHIDSYVPDIDESNTGGWVRWLNGLLPKIDSARNYWQSGLEENIGRRIEALDNLERKVKALIGHLEEDSLNWILLRDYDNVEFKPIMVDEYTGELFGNARKKLLMSATILDPRRLSRYLGIPEAHFIDVPSVFPRENRPIRREYVGRMTKDTKDSTIPGVVRKINGILEKHKHEKGIIHTVSYDNLEYIVRNCSSDTRQRLRWHYDSSEREKALQKHVETLEPTVLISPSMAEGVDFKDDLSRFQVMIKVPYPYLGDPQIKRRSEIDSAWYQWRTAVNLVQTYGRSVRSEDDYATTYVLDSSFEDFVSRNRRILPNWFLEAIE